MHGGIPTFVHVRSMHARDDCEADSAVSIAKRIFFFPFSFFPKRIGRTRKTGYQVSPAVGGEETGGGMRPVLSYCVLPGFTIFIIIIFIISISAVLLFLNIIQMAQLAAFPPSLST